MSCQLGEEKLSLKPHGRNYMKINCWERTEGGLKTQDADLREGVLIKKGSAHR